MSLIGRRVEYSHTGSVDHQGKVIDKVLCSTSSVNSVAITGYLCEDENTGELVIIQGWRLKRTLPDDTNQPKVRGANFHSHGDNFSYGSGMVDV